MGDVERSVKRMLDAYGLAIFTKDAEAFLRLYDSDVRVFDTWGSWSYEGAASWRKMVDGWFSSLGSECVRVTFDDVQVVAGHDLSGASAIVTYAGVSAEGKQLREMQNRISWVLKGNGGSLAIVHEHTSAPIGFEDVKAILQRTPAS